MNPRRAALLPGLLVGALLCFAAENGPAAERTGVPKGLLEDARRQRLAEHPEWRRLLHYRKTLFGTKSEVDGRAFFFSKRGRRDSSAELEATLAAFFAPAPEDPDAAAACRFPARFEWLKKNLDIESTVLPAPSCPKLEGWLAGLNAGSLSVVYASAYLNNPASMYGHTFLRVRRAGQEEPVAHLDYTINFAAETAESSGIIFAARGLLGLYPGKFTTSPYYFKVQRYNNIEGRDLWEYDLALDHEQVRRVILHLWETRDTHFAYFFLNQNCSYQPLALLDVADPKLGLSDEFRWKTIPVDSVRIMTERPGLVTRRRFRPSLMKEIAARRSRLTEGELQAAERIGEKPAAAAFEPLAAWPPHRQALVLDTAYDYFRHRRKFKRYQIFEADAEEREILMRRGRLGVKSSQIDPAEIPPESPPESGHKSGRAGWSQGWRKGSAFEELSIRPALHDLADDARGYIPHSQLEMFHLKVRYDNDRKKLHLERFTLLDIVSLSPWDRWVKPLSWKLFAGIDTAKDLGRPPEKSKHFRLGGGAGATLGTRLWRREAFYVLAEGDGGLGGTFRDDYRVGFGGEAGVAGEIASFWRALFEWGVRRYPAGHVDTLTRARTVQSFTLSRNVEFRGSLLREGPGEEAMLTLHWYF